MTVRPTVKLRRELDQEEHIGRNAKGKRLSPEKRLQMDFKFSKFQRSVATVKCEQTEHQIIVTERGRLVLTGHEASDADAHMVMKFLGSKTRACKCISIFKLWTDYLKGKAVDMQRLPEGIRKEGMRARYRRSKRKHARRTMQQDWYQQPMKERPSYIAKIAARVITTTPEYLAAKAANPDDMRKCLLKIEVRPGRPKSRYSRPPGQLVEVILDLPSSPALQPHYRHRCEVTAMRRLVLTDWPGQCHRDGIPTTISGYLVGYLGYQYTYPYGTPLTGGKPKAQLTNRRQAGLYAFAASRSKACLAQAVIYADNVNQIGTDVKTGKWVVANERW